MVEFPRRTGGFLNPQKIIESLSIVREGMKIADFGCGHGYFTLPLARKVGKNGKVFALDILSEALEAVTSQMKINGIENIEVKRCNLEKERGSRLEDSSCDVVLISNLLFQTEEDDKIIKEAKRILKKGGKVIFIDWRPDVPLGPVGKRVKPEEAVGLFERENFKKERDFFTDHYHYGMVFTKD